MSLTVLVGLLPFMQLELPMNDLKASYPYGEQRALTVSSDRRVAFVAEGAAIAILDCTQFSQNLLPLVDRVEVPECAPMALLHYRHPVSSQDWLFIAGGSEGVWRIDLCSSLFTSPPTSCSPTSYNPVRIAVVETANWERKVCIDIAVVDGNAAAGDPLLCAIFAARGDAAIGPSEARFYRLQSNGNVQQYGSSVTLTSSATTANSLAHAVAADPGDPNSVYVSMGTGWLHKIDITSSSFTLSPVAVNPVLIPRCGATTCPEGERMRDIAVVKTANYGSFLYAALNYGRILEFQLGTSNVRATQLSAGFTDRIAAVTDGGDRILIAAANQTLGSLAADSWVIFRALGVWYNPCLDYYAVDGNSGFLPANNKIYYFKRDASTSSTSPPTSELVLLGDQESFYFQNSLVLTQLTATRYGSFESNHSGTTVRRVINPFTAAQLTVQQPLLTYRGPAQGAGDGLFSALNNGFTFFGGEGRSQGLMYVTSTPDIVPIAGTDALCSAPQTALCTECEEQRPNPYFGSLMGDTHWVDPNAQQEWFMSGEGRAWNQFSSTPSCGPITGCYRDPCSPTICWQLAAEPNLPFNQTGWKLIRMNTALITENSTAVDLDMRWMQIAWDASQQPSAPASTPYVHTMADQRIDATSGFPKVIHTLRGGSRYGYTLMDGQDLAVQAAQLLGSCHGRGDFLAPDMIAVTTHPEQDDPNCTPLLACTSSAPRNLFSNRAEQFVLDGPEGPKYIVAIAAGFVAADSGCEWSASSYQPMVVLYDVTHVLDTGTLHPPRLLRVALGSGTCTGPCVACGGACNSSGHAWCVRTRTMTVEGQPRTYAFVGDINARMLVFDVSYDQLFPAATTSTLYSQRLSPIACVCFPVNPWDNQRDNFLDMELDGSYAYCALGRGGIGIVKIVDPANPTIIDIVDTPGIVQGVAFRTNGDGYRQMLAGDINAGLHLFGRLGE